MVWMVQVIWEVMHPWLVNGYVQFGWTLYHNLHWLVVQPHLFLAEKKVGFIICFIWIPSFWCTVLCLQECGFSIVLSSRHWRRIIHFVIQILSTAFIQITRVSWSAPFSHSDFSFCVNHPKALHRTWKLCGVVEYFFCL